MSVVLRVAKAVKDADELGHHDVEEMSRVAVATMFNWLMDPSDEALGAAAIISQNDARTCRRMWSTMLAEMRREAGF